MLMSDYRVQHGVVRPSDKIPAKKRLRGRDLWEWQTVSGYNRLPVNVHSSWVLDGATLDWGDGPEVMTLRELIEWRVIDGALVIQESEGERGPVFEPLDWLLDVTPIRVVQRMTKPDCPEHFFEVAHETAVVRVYSLGDDDIWRAVDWINWGTAHAEPLRPEQYKTLGLKPAAPVPSQFFHVFPFGKRNRGLLEPAAFTIQRLEQIALDIEVLHLPSNAAINYFGILDQDSREEMITKEYQGTTMRFLPTNARAERTVSTDIPLSLMQEQERLERQFFRLVQIVFVNDAQVSGVARKIEMRPMFTQIRTHEEDITTVVEHFGGRVEFAALDVTEPTEREAEMRVLLQARDTGAISNADYGLLVERLLHLDTVRSTLAANE